MRTKFYTRCLTIISFFLFTVSQISAQTTLTTLPNPPYNGSNSLSGTAQITFVLRNNNPTPVRLTGIGNWCTTADNNAIWQLYYTATALSGSSTNITIAPWSLVATGTPTTVVATGITALSFPGLNFIIPGNTQYRFALRHTGPGSCRYTTTATPNTFSGGGVDLLVGNLQIAGLNVGYSGSGTALTITPRYFTGFVTFAPATQPCAENFDGVTAPAFPTGWSAGTPITCAGSLPWATDNSVSNSAPNSAFTNDPNCISDEVLDSKVFPIVSPTAQLSFRNRYELESTFDGMVLEISIGGGPFTDIITAGGSFVTGGYNGTISVNFGSPILGRQAWTGNSGGFITTTVNLPAAANGQNVVFRWRRATDSSIPGTGVWIDDITLTGSNCVGACIITCPPNITVSNDPNQCGAIVNYPAPTTNGACGPLTASPASGSFFPVGNTTVTVSSFAGPQCTFIVRVNDTQPPTITCPSNMTVGNSPGQCGATVNFAPVTSDNCPGVTVSSVPASGSFFPLGTTTVTSTATDASGNTATCSFTVTVSDTEPPTFSSPGLFPERLYYKFDGAGTSVPNLATAPPPGTATATITGLTQGGTGKCGGALIGTGTSGQSMNTNWATNMTGSWSICFWLGPNQVDNNPSYLFGDVTATGGATGAFRCFYGGAALTNNMLLRGGSSDVLITGVNPGATFITIVYNGVNTVVYKNGGSPQTYNVTFPSVGAGPFRVGGYSSLASINGAMDEFGMFTRALTPAEVLSLFNTCPVNVNNCPSNITVNAAPGVCNAVVNYTTPVAIDNCPGVVTVQTQGLPSGSTFPVGTTTQTFVATDAVGLTATCTFTVTVVDAQPPSVTCPGNQVRNTDAGQCYATYTPPQPTIADNCAVTRLTWTMSGATTGSSPATGINYVPSTQFQLTGTTGTGLTTITYTAADAAGNTTTCSFTVRVNDASIPVISTQPATKFVCAGSDGVFSVIASAGAGNPLTYQWQQWNGTTWVDIAGATASTLTIPAVSFAQNTNTYRCILTGRCSVVTSGTATLYVNPLPTVNVVTSIPPAMLPGQVMNISSTVSPTGGSYQWFKNNVAIASPLAQGPILSNLTVSDIGTYKLVYTDLNGCVNTSSDVVITGLASENLWVYPVPNNGSFQVRYFNQVGEQATIRIFDAKGAKVYERSAVTNTAYTRIDVELSSASADGVYVVELVNAAGKRVGAKQIIVRRVQ